MKSFYLSKIKSFEQTPEIELKKINLFVGKNSSGKSSLIRFPVVLSQTFQENILTPILLFGKLIDYGNFDDVVYGHKGNEFGFGFTFTASSILKNAIRRLSPSYFRNKKGFLENEFDIVKMDIKVKKNNNKITVDNFNLYLDDKKLLGITKDSKKNQYSIVLNHIFKKNRAGDWNLEKIDNMKLFDAPITFSKFIPDINMRLISDYIRDTHLKFNEQEQIKTLIDKIENSRFMWESEYINEMIKEFEFEENVSSQLYEFVYIRESITLFSSILSASYNELNRLSEEVTYIGPFRKDPERIYRESENSYRDVGKNGENTSLLLRQADSKKNLLLKRVSEWFETSMGYSINIDEIDNSNLFKLMVTSLNGKNKDNLIDVGYGIAQVLPIVTQLFLDNKKSDAYSRNMYSLSDKKMIIIEQPELHLHPSAQSSLADLFVEKVKNDRGSKLLIETHSEHLIRKLQVLIADPEVDINSDDVAIYYVDKTDEGDAQINVIELNEKGQFVTPWPSGFFDKSYELTKQLLLSSKKRG